MERNIAPLWLDNDIPPVIKRRFKLIDIGTYLGGGAIFFLLGVTVSWYFFIGGIITLLSIAVANYIGSLLYPIKIGLTSEGLYYITKQGKKSFILWDSIESVRDTTLTKKELYLLVYKERKTTNILTINKNVFSTIKPHLRNVKNYYDEERQILLKQRWRFLVYGQLLAIIASSILIIKLTTLGHYDPIWLVLTAMFLFYISFIIKICNSKIGDLALIISAIYSLITAIFVIITTV